ncbi:TonB-dependent receptor [Hyphomonas sp.]|uniref:TonB-dependent receptor n=1 Tax=Hyphomonas sp. TaxID=87 RepID=UPI0025C0A1EE|nr:TonB-dependent receptor [Hyphomonas sp.]
MKRAFRAVTLCGASMGVLLASAPAVAQEDAATEDAERVYDAVIVTAQKRAQDIVDVGATINAIGAGDIQERRIEQVTDFVNQLANVDVKDNSPGILPVISIRGVGLNDFSATNNPAAGVYVDEVYLSSLALLNTDFFDLERLEALRGPQGTLYGRNSTAGAINIISARPNFDGPSGRVAAGYGNYQTADLEAAFNAPVSDTLAVRLSGKYINQGEGFFYDTSENSDVGQRDVLLGRFQALWTPTSNFQALFKLEGQRVRSEVGAGEFFGALPNGSAVCPGSPQCTDFLGYSDPDTDPYRGDWSVDPAYDVDQIAATLRLEADLGGVTVTSITGYLDFERQWGAETDGGPFRQTDFIETDDIQQFSQEVRLSGEAGKAAWIAGVFYSTDDVVGQYDGNLQDLFNTTYLTLWDQTSTSAAVFGNVDYALTDTLTLVAGLRYTSEEKSNRGSDMDLVSLAPGSGLSLAPFGTPPLTLASINDTIDDTNWSWKLGANWTPADDSLIYASISQGTKSGGFFSGVATNSGQLQPYDPETLLAYEVGAKRRAGAYDLSGSVFYYDYQDVQTFIRDDSGGLPIQRLGNVDEATIFGADLTASFRPASLQGLTLSASLGLLDTELGAFTSSAGLIPAGKELPNAPEVSGTLGAEYEHSVSSDWTLRLQGEGRYADAMFNDSLNDPLIASDAYWTYNGRIILSNVDGWSVSLWGRNLADERYVTQGVNNLALGYGYRVYGAPRTYGVSVGREF